jgi:hypothetical protein
MKANPATCLEKIALDVEAEMPVCRPPVADFYSLIRRVDLSLKILFIQLRLVGYMDTHGTTI